MGGGVAEKGRGLSEKGAIAYETPTKKKKMGRHGTMEYMSTPEQECLPPKFHRWEEFSDPVWAKKGNTLEGKCCIGIRNKKRCGREFVGKVLEDRTHVSDTKYHITSKNCAYGCPVCIRYMCAPCRWHYDDTVACSPVQKKLQPEVTEEV